MQKYIDQVCICPRIELPTVVIARKVQHNLTRLCATKVHQNEIFKAVTDRVNCRRTGDLRHRSGTALCSDALGRTVSKLDSMILCCSGKEALIEEGLGLGLEASWIQNLQENPMEEAGGNLAKAVKLKTVNVNPWTNDGVKRTVNEDCRDKIPKGNFTRLVALPKDSNEGKNCSSAARKETANKTQSFQAGWWYSTTGTSQKFLKPGRIVCSYDGCFSRLSYGWELSVCLKSYWLLQKYLPNLGYFSNVHELCPILRFLKEI